MPRGIGAFKLQDKERELRDREKAKAKEALDLSPPARTLSKIQPYQAYINMDRERVLGIIRHRYKAYRESLPEGVEPRKWLGFMSEHAKKMLEEEPQDVRDAVEENRTKITEDAGIEMLLEPGEDITAEDLRKRAIAVQEYVSLYALHEKLETQR